CDILPAYGSVPQLSERLVRELQSRFVIIHHENRLAVAGLDPTALERFQDFAWRHGLRQDIPDFVAHPDSLVGQNAYDDYRRFKVQTAFANFPKHGAAGHIREHHVERDRVKARLATTHQGFGSSRHRLHGVARRREHLNEPGAVFGFIFNNEDERSPRRSHGESFLIHDLARNLRDPRQHRIEDTVVVNRTVHTHFSSLRFYDSLRERQSQTRP